MKILWRTFDFDTFFYHRLDIEDSRFLFCNYQNTIFELCLLFCQSLFLQHLIGESVTSVTTRRDWIPGSGSNHDVVGQKDPLYSDKKGQLVMKKKQNFGRKSYHRCLRTLKNAKNNSQTSNITKKIVNKVPRVFC